MSLSPKAQNAFEFASLLGIMMLVFLIFFSFISQNITSVTLSQESQSMQYILRTIDEHIRFAAQASDNYQMRFDVPSQFSLQRQGDEIIVQNDNGDSQVLFLTLPVYGDVCNETLEIIHSTDYGVGICCGTCVQFPDVNLSQLFECKIDTYWESCEDITPLTLVKDIRTRCPFGTTSAQFSFTELPATILLQTTLDQPKPVENITWVSGNIDTIFNLGAYRLDAQCPALISQIITVD